ncbi:MAG TPA: ATP synthase F1 subunit gamma [Gemmataceae bacterium]|jgi:F-type H+-transporting ATPase subunit gamma|nr:ATP synthase F1 subunit gamma [Gemmataceae bacterium]
MANKRALVKRRKAIRNIRKITRTMELIATSRFKRAFDRASEAQAYTQKIGELAADLSDSAGEVTHPLLEKRETIKTGVLLVLSSNRGLCGGYNGSILREATAAYRQATAAGVHVQLEASGKRAIAYYRFQQIPTTQTYTQFEDKPTYEEVEELANRYLADYIAGKIDRVQVGYMKFLNAAKQAPVVETLLPLSPEQQTESKAPGGPNAKKLDYEYLPSAANILEELLPVSFKIRLFKCFLDAAVSEQIARRVAMKAATENAGEIIKSLNLQYNRVRQAQITKEISEIIGGVEALK